MPKFGFIKYTAAAFAASGFTSQACFAENQPRQPVLFGETQLRYEGARTDQNTKPADGITQAIRVGVESGLTSGIRLLAEGEFVYSILDNFNDGTGDNPLRPVIPNPDTVELNRLQLQATISNHAFLTVGRQTLALDDQRFIGPARFRPNNQTFDAIHFSYRPGNIATLQAGYIWRTNRILGGENVNGRFRGDSYFLNATVRTPIGRLGAFHYALDLETGPGGLRNNRFSSRTTGIRIDGRQHRDTIGVDWTAAYARQTDFAQNPANYAADYWLTGATVHIGPSRLGFRRESLGAGNGQSFQTPLGTRRKFQGLADVFLVTPADGVIDTEISASWDPPAPRWVNTLTLMAKYHWFKAERGSLRYGSELDFTLNTEFWRAEWSMGIAHYSAINFASDTDRIFLNMTKRF